MNNIDYVPVLKWKTGEKESINQLNASQKNKIMPLVELVDSISINDLADEISNIFTGPLLIDNLFTEDSNFEFYKGILHSKISKNLIPVFYIDDLFNNPAITNIFDTIAIRLQVPEPIESLSYIEFFSNLFSKSETKIIIILDLIFVDDDQNATLKFTALKSILNELKKYNDTISNIVISSTSFPKDLNNLEAGKDIKCKRYEFILFNKIKNSEEFDEFKNKLIYSDYGVNKFTETNIDFSKMQYGVLPKIKYTTDKFYYIQKAEKDRLRNVYTVSVYDMSERIVNSGFFYGKDFSYGDSEIYDRANKKKGPGGNTNWVTFSTTHHIAVILNQLSNHPSI